MKTLAAGDIIGQRLIQFFQTYELLEGDVDFALNYFVLESGLVFRLPCCCHCKFDVEEVPITAEEVCHPLMHRVVNTRIARVCYERDADTGKTIWCACRWNRASGLDK
jgi:hypothetical protein